MIAHKQQEGHNTTSDNQQRADIFLVLEKELLSLHASLDLRTVLTSILESAARIARSEASTLFLIDKESGDLFFSVPTGPAADKLVDMRIKKGVGIAGWVAQNEKPIVVRDVNEDPRFHPEIDKLSGFQTRSILSVPLKSKGKVIGVLEAMNKQEGLTFSKDDVSLFSTFADHAALAIENAQLHESLDIQSKENCRMQGQLAEAEKKQALERLSAGIAHDLKNIINAISGFSELALLDVHAKPIREDIGEILKASNSAMDLVEQILTFTSQSQQEKIPLKSQQVLKQAIKLFRIFLPETIAIRGNFSFQDGLILADPKQMHQAITNLLKNARDAIGDYSGVLNIESSLVELSKNQVLVHPGLKPGWYIKFTISDDGCGIDPETLKKIFDPYFTTKTGGVGTGMGLPTARSIVVDHGGAITVSSVPGEGTQVDVLLPKIIAEVESEPLTFAQLPKGSERVMVVDDERTVVFTLSKMLGSLGYECISVNNSEEALEIYRDDPDSIDLVLTDWTMPGLTGDRLAEKINEIRSDAKVIIYSAFSGEIDQVKFRANGIRDTLEKPISMENLANTVRIVLDES
ncbi:MAG: GAF domain-containing protein [Desulfobacterales bacterium]|nr:GAF domain-containing protein [Desulfobacterales bacterium]